MSVKPLVLFDIDGVLADDSHRVQFALDQQWDEYFNPERMSQDAPLLEGIQLAQVMADVDQVGDLEVQYLTGRRVDLYNTTRTWLESHALPNPERITMRGFADRDILARYKAGVIGNAIRGGEFQSVTLYEDDPAVVDYVNILYAGREDVKAHLTTWYVKKSAMVKAAIA